MDMVPGDRIAAADLTDWRKLAQGLHARFRAPDFAAAARFVVAIGEAGDEVGHHPRVAIGTGYVDLELVSDDAVYRDDDGTEYVIEWVTQQDIDLARRLSAVAADLALDADPAAVSEFEAGLGTARSSVIAPVWAALLTGDAAARGRGTPGDEIRDATGRVPNLWFGDVEEDSGQRVHLEVYVPVEVAEDRVAAVIAAGGTVVSGDVGSGLVVVADQEGNRGVLCVDVSAATPA